MIKAVIFNMNGVIFDANPFIWEARKEYFKEKEVVLSEGEIKNMLGMPLIEQIKIIEKTHDVKLDYDDMSPKLRKLQEKLMKDKIKLNEGVLELIYNLKKKGIKIVIGSMNLREFVLKDLSLLDIDKTFFDLIVTFDDVEHSNKNVVKLILEKLDLEPSECAYINDSIFGLKMAKNEGVYSIGLTNVHGEKKSLEKVSDLVVDSLKEVDVGRI